MAVKNTPSPSCPLAITCGDPAGVGPEIVAGWCRANPELRKTVCLIGPRHWLDDVPDVAGKAVGADSFLLTPGEPSVEGAKIAAEALEEAAYGCRQGRYSGVVTAPISKSWMQQAGWSFPGHTEFFAERWYGEPSMAFAGGKLKIVLATWHIPLSEVPSALSQSTLERAVKNAAFLAKTLGSAEPRIAVCGLNPHAGEDGLLGFEEKGVINPILATLRETYPGLSECLPGDTVFWRQLQGDFDVVIALYHDQGLAPLKTIDFDQAVNITLGLPFIRTSPDHGTAYSLAGTGKASGASFANAVTLAHQLSLF